MDVYTSVVMAAIGRIIAVGSLVAGSFAACLFASSGCAAGFDWNGTWKGARPMGLQPGTPVDVQNSIKQVSLTIQPTGSFQLIASGIPYDGLFFSSGRTATLQVVNKFNRALDQTQNVHLKANKDGTITLDSPDSFDGSPIVLHRESQPASTNVRNP